MTILTGFHCSFLTIYCSAEVFDCEDEEDQKPRSNPFDDKDTDTFEVVDFATTWVSQTEVKNFMNQSRGLPENDDDDEDNTNLGEAWGGASFSITSGMTIWVSF